MRVVLCGSSCVHFLSSFTSPLERRDMRTVSTITSRVTFRAGFSPRVLILALPFSFVCRLTVKKSVLQTSGCCVALLTVCAEDHTICPCCLGKCDKKHKMAKQAIYESYESTLLCLDTLDSSIKSALMMLVEQFYKPSHIKRTEAKIQSGSFPFLGY